jgi:predicted RNase H-like HicB family nuclease
MSGMTREEYLRVPYVLVVESIEKPGGQWLRRASYPELSGAHAEAESVIEAMEEADGLRVEIILDRLDRGIPVPVPRPPL